MTSLTDFGTRDKLDTINILNPFLYPNAIMMVFSMAKRSTIPVLNPNLKEYIGIWKYRCYSCGWSAKTPQ